jgi:hypothetical protein
LHTSMNRSMRMRIGSALSLCHVTNVRDAQRALADVPRRWSSGFAIARDAELHGSDPLARIRRILNVPPRVRRAIFDDALDALIAAEPHMIIRGVERRRRVYAHPHRIAWRYAIENVDELIEQVRGTPLVVADEHAEMEAALRGDIVEYAETTTGGSGPGGNAVGTRARRRRARRLRRHVQAEHERREGFHLPPMFRLWLAAAALPILRRMSTCHEGRDR